MANNNNPSGYIPPAPSAISDPLPPKPAASNMGAPACIISRDCIKESETTPVRHMYCDQYEGDAFRYFECVCEVTQSLSGHRAFSPSCVLNECVGDEARKLFIKQFRAGCVEVGKVLLDIPPAWRRYDELSGEFSSTSALSTAQTTSDTSALPSTSTQLSTLTQASSVVTSTASSITSTSQPSTTTSNSTAPAMPTPTGPDGGQIPICGIPEKCMTTKPQGEASCNVDDLDCICKASNSLENNTEFNQQCVLDACYGDIGREEFLGSFYYHCNKVDKELTDIPRRWEPYLPATFPSATPTPVPINSDDPTPPPAGVKLNGGAIAGIVIGAVIIFAIVLGLLRLWWNKKREAKTLRVEVAELHDATNPDGMSRRINTLLSDSSIRSFTHHQETSDTGPGAEASRYGTASTYNDATLVGSPRSTVAYPISPTNRTGPFKEYGTSEEDYAMSEYNKYPGHGRQYSRGHHELPNNQVRESQVMQDQRHARDDSASEYSVRRPSDDADSVQIRQDREARERWNQTQRDEREREREQDRHRRSVR